jgi:hypothetical protein
MASYSLILVPGYDPGYLRIYEHLVKRSITAGLTPLVLDITPVSAVPVDSYHRGALKVARLPYPGHDLAPRMEKLGATYLTVGSIASKAVHRPLTPEQSELLDIAVQSALITYFRTDAPNRKIRRVRRTAHALRQEGEAVYDAVSRLASSHTFAVAYLPNGRFPHQKMATLAAHDAGIPTMHFEKGETPNGAYVQPYAPQNRLESQAAVSPTLARFSDTEIEAMAHEWLARRAPAKDSRNEFSAGWTETLPQRLVEAIPGKKVIGFFTSSQDEFQFLGPEWQLHSWESQFEAFNTLISHFESLGYLCYLRVHPNLATKAHECYLREREGSQQLADLHPNLIVIWHDDPTSTYSLLGCTDGVVVWDSTVGLEASAKGTPVWTCATSRYGLVADIREILGKESATAEALTPWSVDKSGALRFIAYLVNRDDQMPATFEPWLAWDRENPPFASKVAALLVSGGAPTVRDAVTSSIDVWRHRSRSFNATQVKSKLSK